SVAFTVTRVPVTWPPRWSTWVCARGIADIDGKGAGGGAAASVQGDLFTDVHLAIQCSAGGIVTQREVIDLVRGAPGLLPYPQAVILGRRRAAARVRPVPLDRGQFHGKAVNIRRRPARRSSPAPG